MPKNLINFLIILVVGLAIGLIVGWFAPEGLKTGNWFNSGSPDRDIIVDAVHSLRGRVSAVKDQTIKFDVRELARGEAATAGKTAQIEPSTALYLLSPKTAAEADEEYLKKVLEVKSRLKQAAQAQETDKVIALREELSALSLTASDARDRQAEDLNVKINSLPADSAERREAERAYLELTSAFKYSIITPTDIKTGDAIQVWSDEDLRDQDKFVATRIEIKR